MDTLLATLALLAGPWIAAVPAGQECLPAGGGTVEPAVADAGDFRITGGGSGHGAGMSQYGAHGAARLGCDAQSILETYYPGAKVEPVGLPDGIRVSLDTEATRTPVTGVAGSIPWERCGPEGCTDLGVTLEQGSTWMVEVRGDSYVISEDGSEVWQGGAEGTRLRAHLSETEDDERIVRIEHRYRWGVLEFDAKASPSARMFVTLEIAPFDRYLYGIAEVPSSWPRPALEAQVIAARSYALTRRERHGGQRPSCHCDVYASQRDQVYAGYEKEQEGEGGAAGRRWREAVEATRLDGYSSAQVLRHEGRTVEAFYSSSHAGQSESSRFVFGRGLPYLQPVDDSRWESAGDNPLRVWAETFSAEELGQALEVGRALEVILPGPQGAGCRVGDPQRGYGGVLVRGTEGERLVSGDEFRRALGLRSTLFAVNADVQGGCPDGGPAGVRASGRRGRSG